MTISDKMIVQKMYLENQLPKQVWLKSLPFFTTTKRLVVTKSDLTYLTAVKASAGSPRFI